MRMTCDDGRHYGNNIFFAFTCQDRHSTSMVIRRVVEDEYHFLAGVQLVKGGNKAYMHPQHEHFTVHVVVVVARL